MKLRKLLLLIFLTFALTVAASAYDWQMTECGSIATNFGTVTKVSSVTTTEYGRFFDKCYSYPDGASFSSKNLTATTAIQDNAILDSYELNGSTLHIKYYDSISGKWVSRYIASDCIFDYGMYFIRLDDLADMIICLPQAYIGHENETIEALAGQTGKLLIEKTETGWILSIIAPYTYSACNIEYFVLKSSNVLVDWNFNMAEQTWSGYQFTGDNRWCYDGYYYICPYNYIPTGENYYYKLPAAYIACKFVYMGQYFPAAKYMCIAMMDTISVMQNDAGYFPTKPGSEWLQTDYGIGPGFYDTRFNTDVMIAYLEAAENYGVGEFDIVVTKYINFFTDYATKHHDTVKLSDGYSGWLVYDYWNPTGGKKTHTSLNHQLAEIILLEKVYQKTGNSLVLYVEEMLFRGIRGTEKSWYKSDHNLEYGWLNGKMTGQDYPYLTYNDLYDLDALYYQRLGYHVQVLSRLMKSKKIWMDNNSVTGYNVPKQ